MTDIVARLRYLASPGQDGRKLSHAPDFAAAADEIERLRAALRIAQPYVESTYLNEGDEEAIEAKSDLDIVNAALS